LTGNVRRVTAGSADTRLDTGDSAAWLGAEVLSYSEGREDKDSERREELHRSGGSAGRSLMMIEVVNQSGRRELNVEEIIVRLLYDEAFGCKKKKNWEERMSWR